MFNTKSEASLLISSVKWKPVYEVKALLAEVMRYERMSIELADSTTEIVGASVSIFMVVYSELLIIRFSD